MYSRKSLIISLIYFDKIFFCFDVCKRFFCLSIWERSLQCWSRSGFYVGVQAARATHLHVYIKHTLCRLAAVSDAQWNVCWCQEKSQILRNISLQQHLHFNLWIGSDTKPIFHIQSKHLNKNILWIISSWIPIILTFSA